MTAGASAQDALVQRAHALMLGAHPELAAGYAQVMRLLLAQPVMVQSFWTVR